MHSIGFSASNHALLCSGANKLTLLAEKPFQSIRIANIAGGPSPKRGAQDDSPKEVRKRED